MSDDTQQRVSEDLARKIIDDEGMGFAAVGPVQSLTLQGDQLSDGDVSEPANLSSPEAFRAQVRSWREDCGL